MTEVRQLIADAAATTHGVIGIVISDRDGVPVLKTAVEPTSSPLVDGCFRHQFLSVYSTLSNNSDKMCLGPTVSIMATFDDYQVVHCHFSPLILTIIASNDAMTGQLMTLSQTLKPLVNDMAKYVVPL